MSQPGDTVDHLFEVRDTSGAVVTGLVTANFTFTAKYRTTAGSWSNFTHGAVVTEIGSGKYGVRFTLPTVPAFWAFYVAHASHTVNPPGWEDELEAADIASIAALVNRPVVRVAGSGTLGQQASLPTIIAWRKVIITLTVEDASGNPVALASEYSDFKVGFRSQTDQDADPPALDAEHGTPADFSLVVDDNGLIVITIPDDLSIFGVLDEGADPTASVTIDMEVTAELPSGQTVSVVAPSNLTIKKRAEGSGTP